MASISPGISDPPGWADDPLEVRRVPRGQRRLALGLLMTGRLDEHDPAVDQFLAFARQQSLDLEACYAAWSGQRMLASALVVPGPGRTAMLFIMPVGSPAVGAVVTRVVRRAVEQLDAGNVRLVQSLTDPDQHDAREALEAAGLTTLAELVYMQAYVSPQTSGDAEGQLGRDTGLRALDFSPRNRPLFERAILDSYIDTLDCPALRGVRQIEDIIAGHMATGRFDPRLWRVWMLDDEPVAVTLVANLLQRGTYELVYLGVRPEQRGRGLGKRLMQCVMQQVASRGGGRLQLAVDDRNTPAMKLYRTLGFRATAHKHAMIAALG